MKQYIANDEPKKKKKKKKKHSGSVITKKDFGLTENAKIIME
jgi:hypothetical protein